MTESTTAFVTRQIAAGRRADVRYPINALGLFALAGAVGMAAACEKTPQASGRASLVSMDAGNDSAIGTGGRAGETGGTVSTASGGQHGKAGNDAGFATDGSTCKAMADSCTIDSECCSGICGAAPPSVPRSPPMCQRPGCTRLGQPCADVSECCDIGQGTVLCMGTCRGLSH